MLIVSGIVRISRYPLTAATNARPIPVLPLVGSISTVLPGLIFPARSASVIMLTPMRSFTLPTGFWLSSLATTSATQPPVTLFSRTSGVCPISSVMSFAIFIVRYPFQRLQQMSCLPCRERLRALAGANGCGQRVVYRFRKLISVGHQKAHLPDLRFRQCSTEARHAGQPDPIRNFPVTLPRFVIGNAFAFHQFRGPRIHAGSDRRFFLP